MCQGCWEDHGSPTELPHDGLALAEAAKDVDAFGAFQIVVDDFNVEDHHLDSCISSPDALDHEVAWGKRMRELTVAQRAAVLGKMDGFF